jgi:hypothetical protein
MKLIKNDKLECQIARCSKTQVLPLQMCGEAHYEIWLRRTEIIIICSTRQQLPLPFEKKYQLNQHCFFP